MSNSIRTALVLVDLQPDFMPGGALAVAEGDHLVEPVRDLVLSGRFDVVVATQDWHPAHHISFASHHTGKKPFDVIDLYGHEQVLWPDHCVQGTPGAALHPGMPRDWVDAIMRKGNDPAVDSYSAFRNNWNRWGDRPPTGLGGYLRERGVTHLVLCGLARDYCVKWTAEDAVEAGFHVQLLWDLTRPVDPASDERVLRELRAKGVEVQGAEAKA
jgi:nicotinamidase/pyrazinamidase